MSSYDAFSGIMCSIPVGTQVVITAIDTGTNAQTSEDLRLDVIYPDGVKISAFGCSVESACQRLQKLHSAEMRDGFLGLHHKKPLDTPKPEAK